MLGPVGMLAQPAMKHIAARVDNRVILITAKTYIYWAGWGATCIQPSGQLFT
jgi:hypothetical protein